MYTLWYSTEDFASFIKDNSILKERNVKFKKLYESDANNPTNFHNVPDHIKKILYLDCPDLIIEYNSEPILSIEVSTEAGTGHNVFQRFARLAAAVENNVPSIYIYPEAVIITRNNSNPVWDKINPLIYSSLEKMMRIFNIPVLLFHFPSDYQDNKTSTAGSINLLSKGLRFSTKYPTSPDENDTEIKSMFGIINELIQNIDTLGVHESRLKFINLNSVNDWRNLMISKYDMDESMNSSPITATKIIKTSKIIDYLEGENFHYHTGDLLRSRNESVVYCINAKFRGDPYPGALSAIDYLLTRTGKTFEDRDKNLILVWGNLIETDGKISVSNDKGASVNNFVSAVKNSESKNLLNRNFEDIPIDEIPRYYMQVRYGSSYSKVKHIRIYSYFADAILFPDGALWRNG